MAEQLPTPKGSVYDFQAALTHYLLQGSPEAHAPLQTWLATQDGAGATAAGLLVYRNNVMHSLREALAAQYPAVLALVGPDFFAALARDYIAAFPPANPVLAVYGEQLPGFIRQHKACAPLPWLGDVARLEWLCQSALHAADDPLLQHAALLQAAAEQLGDVRLQLHRSARLFSSPWPVHEIRSESLKAQPQAVALEQDQPTQLLVYRQGWQVQVVALQAPAYLLLEALHHGATLAASWAQVQEQSGIDEAELLPLLVYLLQLGVFSTHSFEDADNDNNNDGANNT